MGFQDFNRIGLGAPSAPASGATAVLFDSTVSFKMGLRAAGVARIGIAFPGLDKASATSGLKAYVSADRGVTWKLMGLPYVAADASQGTLPLTVPADTGVTSAAYDVSVVAHDNVKITFTAGGTGPSTWTPVIAALAGSSHSWA